MNSRMAPIAGFAAIAIGAGLLLGRAGGLEPDRPLEFSCLILAAILISVLRMRPWPAEGLAATAPLFAIDFASLLLFGPVPTLLVIAAGAVAQGLADSTRARLPRQLFSDAVIAAVATLAASLVHRVLGGTSVPFVWPSQGVPIAAAVAGYAFAKNALLEARARVAGQPSHQSWPTRALRECPIGFVAAGVAVGLVEVIDHRAWAVLPVAAVPLSFVYRWYADYLSRLEEDRRRLEVVESLEQGMSVIDIHGRVTLWSDALERMVGCPRQRAVHRSLCDAMPALARTELPRAMSAVLKERSPRTLSCVAMPSAAGTRIFQIKILPVAGGVTLLWQDVTERTGTEHALRRSQERFALAAEGANDGLWEWDLRTQELYFSGRWKAMLGLPPSPGIGRPEEWLGRVHPDDIGPLREALNAYVSGTTDLFRREHRMLHEDGAYRWFLCRGVAVRGAGRRFTRIAGSLTDTTEQAHAQERLRDAGSLDALTGLSNRTVFVERLGRRLEDLKHRRGHGRFAVLYLDLDRFKVVNDSLGHLVGDELLAAVSRRLESCLRDGDSLARLGGDEFAILLNTIGDEAQANAIAFRIQEVLSAPVSVSGREVFTSASIGIAFGHADYADSDELMHNADTAMYHAKTRGKARHELFDADMHARTRDRLGLENDLRHAVASHSLEVHYQPIVSLASGMCVGFESLIRWTRDGKAVSPATFIPIAEEIGLIEPLGTWILQGACRTFADWKRRFPAGGLEYIAVNVSSRQLMQQHFLRIVEQAIDEAGLKPRDLRIEVTETSLMDNPSQAAAVLRKLRALGVKVYLDDFGTGYSSLSHLHQLPVDALKIDRSFVNSLLLPDRPAIVESILALARTLNTSVVAEGIETEVQARELERLGCKFAQGFLFSHPLSTQAVEDLLVAHRPLGRRTVPPSDVFSSPRFKWPEHIPVQDPGVEGPTLSPIAHAPADAALIPL